MNRITKTVELSWSEYNQRNSDMSRYIGSDGSGNYKCSLCQHEWRGYQRYLYWPIFFRWQRRASHKLITWHGWQVGYEAIEQKVFGWTLHIGPLKICFGSASRLPAIIRYTFKEPELQDDVLEATVLLDSEQ